MTRRPALGPWMKLYGDVVDRKAYYSDRQFRALIEAWTLALRSSPRGTLPSRRALEARIGVEEVAFLFGEGDLVECDGAVCIEGWDVYQSGVLSTERTQKARSGDAVEHDGNSSRTVPIANGTEPSTSTSMSSRSPEETIVEATPSLARTREADRDAFDVVYDVTGQFVWNSEGRKAFIRDVAGLAPTLDDFEIVYRDEYRKTSPLDWHAALKSTKVRLAKMAERAEKAEAEEQRAKANRAVFETPFMRELREAIAENYDKPVETNGHARSSGGPLTPIGDLLPSVQRSVPAMPETPSPSTEARMHSRRPDPVEANSFAPGEAPGESGPDRIEALDGRERREGGS